MIVKIIHEKSNTIYLLKNINQSDRIRVRDLILNILKISNPKEFVKLFNNKNEDMEIPIQYKFSVYDQYTQLEENDYIYLQDDNCKLLNEKILYFLEIKK